MELRTARHQAPYGTHDEEGVAVAQLLRVHRLHHLSHNLQRTAAAAEARRNASLQCFPARAPSGAQFTPTALPSLPRCLLLTAGHGTCFALP